jgi:GDPmannose 4,6-dehydratase
MKKTLITGVTGQDGAYLSRVLLEKGYKVYGTVRDSIAPHSRNLKLLGIENSLELIPTDLLDLSNVIRLLERIKPDEIYNLASQSSVGLSFEQPIGTVEFNIMSTMNLLEAIRILPIKAKFYQASSSEMYGKANELPITEKTALHPVSPYAVSKAASHWMTVNYREAYGIFCSCGILFNHESVLRAGHFVTKKIISTAARINKGSKETLRLGNIEIRRDWGFAPEYVKAMWLMLQQDEPDDYVIATGEAHSLREFVELAFSHAGLDWKDHVAVDKALYRPSEIDVIYGNPAKAKAKIGWEYNLVFENLIKRLVEEELKHGSEVIPAER